MPLLLILVLGLLALAFVLAPLFRARPASAAATLRLNDAIARADEAKQALRDVEFDHQLGNLEADDYEELRAAYENRALGALKTRYEREQALDTLLERELAAVRERVASEAVEAQSDAPPPHAATPSAKAGTSRAGTPQAQPRPTAAPSEHHAEHHADQPASRGLRSRRKGV